MSECEFKKFPRIFLWILILAATSCSNLRYLPENEKLYTGAKVKLKSEETIRKKSELESGVKTNLHPKPNTKFLGLRIRLYIYNIAGTPKKEKGFKHWLKTGVGEPPALLSTVHPAEIADAFDTWFYNKGIFRSETTFEIVEKEKKAKIIYTSVIHPPYKFGKILWPKANDPLNTKILESAANTLILPGKTYEMQLLKQEAERIDAYLKNNGYYYFNPDYIRFRIDSTPGNSAINVKIEVKEDTPEGARVPYTINNIFLTPDYRLSADSIPARKDTVLVDGIYYINDTTRQFKPEALTRAVLFRKNDTYSRLLHERTLSQLTSLGTFKFINLRFNEIDSLNTSLLDANITMTPMMKKSVHAEVEMISKSNAFIGPSFTVGYSNRNAFRGAELMTINLRTSFETQINGQYKGQFSFEIGPEISIYVPKFILPFRVLKPTSYVIPKTKFTIGYDYITRINYFDLKSAKFNFGYQWKPNELVEHEFDPFDIYFSKMSNQSADFNELLQENPTLEKSLEQQFITGLSYSFTYNQQVLERKINQHYFNYHIDLAGNLLSFLSTVFGNRPSIDNPVEVAGEVYSQFIRGEIDYRQFRKLSPKTKLAGRIYMGAGWAYQNSNTLPYTRQFFSGGVNSVRAFSSRSLGPGTYFPPEELASNDYYSQGGDMRLEGNLELRFNMISILKGAIYVDAGNTWLLRPNDALPGGLFMWDTFAKEIAVGTGLGFRFDVDFFVLRFDFAIPIRKPWYPVDQRWVFDEIDFGSSSWRSENFILNIAIGYPF